MTLTFDVGLLLVFYTFLAKNDLNRSVVVVVSVPDYFWLRVGPFFQLSWNSHTPLKRGRLHSDFVGFDMHAESLSI